MQTHLAARLILRFELADGVAFKDEGLDAATGEGAGGVAANEQVKHHGVAGNGFIQKAWILSPTGF